LFLRDSAGLTGVTRGQPLGERRPQFLAAHRPVFVGIGRSEDVERRSSPSAAAPTRGRLLRLYGCQDARAQSGAGANG
jgi:hypothetical protein